MCNVSKCLQRRLITPLEQNKRRKDDEVHLCTSSSVLPALAFAATSTRRSLTARGQQSRGFQ